MDSADISRTSTKKEKPLPPKSPSQIEFERLLKKVKRTDFYQFYIRQDVREKRGDNEIKYIKQNVEAHMKRNQINVFEQHLKVLEDYCKSKNIDCGFVGMPNFMIDSLHDNPEIAREIFDALSSLDWSNENDES